MVTLLPSFRLPEWDWVLTSGEMPIQPPEQTNLKDEISLHVVYSLT